MNPLLEQIYRSGYIEDSQGQRIELFPTSIPYEEGQAIYNLIRQVKPAHTLEIGLAYGISTLFICQALQDNGMGQHSAIDPMAIKLWGSLGLLNVQRAGLEPRLRFLEASSHVALPELLRQQERFEVAFIDGCHRFDYTLLEYFYLDKLLPVGGHLIFDDLDRPAIRKALAFILRNRNYQLAPEFAAPRLPMWRLAARLLKRVAQAPLDLLPSLLFFAHPRYCVFKKLAEDDTTWDFYRSF